MGKQGASTPPSYRDSSSANAEIVRRYKAGEQLASIGVDLDLTRERIRQIVRESGARMPREYKCAVADCFTIPRSPLRYCHAHQRRLDRYGDPLGTPAPREQHGTAARYIDGCRCDLCWKAGAARRKANSARERAHRRHPEMQWYKTC